MARKFIDVHTHIYDSKFDEDFDTVIGDAKAAGVKKIIIVSEGVADCEKIINIAEKYSAICLPGFGVHPVQGDYDGDDNRSVNLKDVEELLPWIEKYKERLVCLGEVGLDFTPRYCKDDSCKKSQREVLQKMIELSKRLDLPLNVHSRSAGPQTVELLKQEGATRVVLHAFSGRPAIALEGVRCGFYFSVPPSIIRNSEKIKLIKAIPLDKLLLETDSPALGPQPGVRNEPKNVVISCEYIAKVKETPLETVVQTLWDNTLRLFGPIA